MAWSKDPEEASRTFGPLDAGLLGLITLAGGLLRFIGVADPQKKIFDEVYYAKEGCYYVKASLKACGLEDANEVHPPLGKWLISIGIRAFGYDSFGWRAAVLAAGTLTIALTYWLARKILASTTGAAVAAGLLAIDPLHFVQSRTAMLDVFVPLFAVAAFLFLAFDRDRVIAKAEARAGPGSLLARPWRLGAGVMAGAAVATKWTGAFVPLALLAVTVTWEISARRRDQGNRKAIARTLIEEGPSIVLFLMIVPVAVYTLSYVGRGLEGDLIALPWAKDSWFHSFWDRQMYMLDFHRGLTKTHSYQSSPWTWLLLKRPVSYFFETDPNGDYREILATGSPFAWWASIPALVYVAYRWVRRRSLRGPEGLILAGFAFSYGPWLLPFVARSAVFLFYFVATLPFMYLAVGYIAAMLGRVWEARVAIALFCATALGFFIFYYPLLTKQALARDDWDKRIWIFDNCDKPPGREVISTVTNTVSGSPVPSESTSNTNADDPPLGWCWI